VSTSWTQAQLDTLEAAIASGTKRVEYQNRSVTYHSLAEMMKLRDKMREALGKDTSKPRRTFTHYSDGLD